MRKLIKIFFSIVLICSIEKVNSQTATCCTGIIFNINSGIGVKGVADENGVIEAYICAGKVIGFSPDQISCNDPNIIYTWDFGDGTTPVVSASLTGVQHTFSSTGSYTVTLTASGNSCTPVSYSIKANVYNCCCTDISVRIVDGQGATFLPTTQIQENQSLTITISQAGNYNFASSLICPGTLPATLNQIVWHFGDGSTPQSSTGFPTHFYQPGTYQIHFELGHLECKNICCQGILFSALPGDGLIDVNYENGLYVASVCAGKSISFSPDQIECNTGNTYTWNFGDNSTPTVMSSLQNIQHAFANVGTYIVTLTASGTACEPVPWTMVVVVSDCSVPTCCTITNVSQISQLITGNTCPISYAAIETNEQTGQMVGIINATTTTCVGRDISFNFSSLSCNSGAQFSVNYGDGYTANNITTANHTYTTAGTYTAVITINSNPLGTCNQTINFVMTVLDDCCPTQQSFLITATSDPSLGDVKKLCAGSPVNLHLSSFGNCSADEAINSAQWTFSNGTAANGQNVQQNFIAPGTYTVSCLINVPNCAPVTVTQTIVVEDCGDIIPCTSCIGSFAPEPGEYIASVWVRELLPVNPNLFASAEMRISFIGAQGGVSIVASSDSKVIDGWQRMEAKITVPAGATQLRISLLNNSANTNNKVYFDDIRIHPFDASMKTYVYDPITLRLVAELDERNYATFYEYDEEGILIRVKKETEKGIMTIKETRQNNSKTGQ